MGYPLIEQIGAWGYSYSREMTLQEYEAKLNMYRQYLQDNSESANRRDQEYNSYLMRWFGNYSCDGQNNYEQRYKSHLLPMSINVYFNH